jgi:hypothetical protein
VSESKVIQVIETSSLRPTKDGGRKHVIEYWSLKGTLLAELDPENMPENYYKKEQ